MRLKEILEGKDAYDENGYRIPRSHRTDNDKKCWECGETEGLELCGNYPSHADPLCLSCRKHRVRWPYEWCNNCKINHVDGVCPIDGEKHPITESKNFEIEKDCWVAPDGKIIPVRATAKSQTYHAQVANQILGNKFKGPNKNVDALMECLRLGYVRVLFGDNRNRVYLQVFDKKQAFSNLGLVIQRLPVETKNVIVEWIEPEYYWDNLTRLEAELKFK